MLDARVYICIYMRERGKEKFYGGKQDGALRSACVCVCVCVCVCCEIVTRGNCSCRWRYT